MKQPVTGVQLYTLRRHTQSVADLDATLAKLSRWGVHDVQFSAIGDSITPEEQKALLDRYGMRVCITHTPFDRMCGDLPAVMEGHKCIGCDSVGLGYAPEEFRRDEDTARAFVKKLNEIGKTLHRSGLRLHYHNHDFEFLPLEGSERTLMDILLQETDPDAVHFIPDVAWLDFAGQDPATFLRAQAGRIKVVHFKDYIRKEDGKPQFMSLGQGVVDLKTSFDVCCEMELPFLMYEQDGDWTNDDPFLATKESLAYLEALKAGRNTP